MNKFKFGDRVRTDKVYRRSGYKREHIEPHGEQDIDFWILLPIKIRGGIYLGTRCIKDGFSEYVEDEGCYFVPTNHITVALVSPDKKRNPVYVPLECLEKEA